MNKLLLYLLLIFIGIILYRLWNTKDSFSIGAIDFYFHYEPGDSGWSIMDDDGITACTPHLSFLHNRGRPINYVVNGINDLPSAIEHLNADITRHNENHDTGIPLATNIDQTTELPQPQPRPLEFQNPQTQTQPSPCDASLKSQASAKREHEDTIEIPEDSRVTRLQDIGFTGDSIYRASVHTGENFLDYHKVITLQDIISKYKTSEYELYEKNVIDDRIMYDGGVPNGGDILNRVGSYWTLHPGYKFIHIFFDDNDSMKENLKKAGNSYEYINMGMNHFLVF